MRRRGRKGGKGKRNQKGWALRQNGLQGKEKEGPLEFSLSACAAPLLKKGASESGLGRDGDLPCSF